MAVVWVLFVVGVVLIMRGLIEWSATIQWAISDDMQPLAAMIGIVTRYAFGTATLVGAAAWAYGSRHRWPPDYAYGKYSSHLHPFCMLSSFATAALLVCVLSGGAINAH